MIGVLIIGDEILSGRREDKHLSKSIELLGERGLRLSWARFVGDEPEHIIAELSAVRASGDVVFSFGGIGATPDDHTRQCAAAALGVALVLHPEAQHEIQARFGGETTPQRLKMGEFPVGAAIIPNPVNRVPGFSIRDHHFVPGFPQMAWPMVEWVLDTHYPHLFNTHALKEASIFVFDAGESQLSDLMYAIEAKWQGLKLFSLPTMGANGARGHIELGVRGAPEQVLEAMQEIRAEIARRGHPFKETLT